MVTRKVHTDRRLGTSSRAAQHNFFSLLLNAILQRHRFAPGFEPLDETKGPD
jgi:hypothetical protein